DGGGQRGAHLVGGVEVVRRPLLVERGEVGGGRHLVVDAAADGLGVADEGAGLGGDAGAAVGDEPGPGLVVPVVPGKGARGRCRPGAVAGARAGPGGRGGRADGRGRAPPGRRAAAVAVGEGEGGRHRGRHQGDGPEHAGDEPPPSPVAGDGGRGRRVPGGEVGRAHVC